VVSTYGCRPGSQIQLDSDLDHLLDRDRKMDGRAARVAGQEREQRLGQPSHVPLPGSDQGFAPMMYTIWPGSPAIPCLPASVQATQAREALA